MSEAKALSLGGNYTQERPIVDVYGKSYKLRLITRSVQRELSRVDAEMRKYMKNGEESEESGDIIVGMLADGLDALLMIDGGHRTPAKKLVMEKWNADALSIDELRVFFDALQDQAVADRPT